MAKGKFAEYTIRGFEQAREQRQRENEFNRKMAEEQRQYGLYSEIQRMRLLNEQRQLDQAFVNVTEGDQYNKFGVTPGQYPVSLLDNVLSLSSKQDNQYSPKVYETHSVQQTPDGSFRVVPHQNLGAVATQSGGGLTPYQQYQIGNTEEDREIKRQERIDKNLFDADVLIAARQSGLVKVTDKTGNERDVYQVGENLIDPKIWKPKAQAAVNALIRDYNLAPVKNALLSQAKKAAKENGMDFESLDANQKRNILKQALDNNQTIPTPEKDVLYKFVEVYTR